MARRVEHSAGGDARPQIAEASGNFVGPGDQSLGARMTARSGPRVGSSRDSTSGPSAPAAPTTVSSTAQPLHDNSRIRNLAEGRLPVPAFHHSDNVAPTDKRRLSLRPKAEAALIPPGSRHPPKGIEPARLAALVRLATEKNCVLEWIDDDDEPAPLLHEEPSDCDSAPGAADDSDSDDGWDVTDICKRRGFPMSHASADQMNALLAHQDLALPTLSRPAAAASPVSGSRDRPQESVTSAPI